MAIVIQMPALSPTMKEGTLAKWVKTLGENITSGDLIAEIETDKATIEFESIDDGVIAKILVEEGAENIPVGAPIAILAEEGEDIDEVAANTLHDDMREEGEDTGMPLKTSLEPAAPAPVAENSAIRSAPVATEIDTTPPSVPAAAATALVETTPPMSHMPPISENGQGETRIKASPLARRLARNANIDLDRLRGSGPSGRIVKKDVEAAIATAPSAAPAAQTQPIADTALPPVHEAPGMDTDYPVHIPHETKRLSLLRKTIARRMTEAKSNIPHIYLTLDVELDAMLSLRKDVNASLKKRNIKVSVNDFLIKALGRALIDVPEANVAISNNQLITYQRADISVAVSIPGGLVTPIIEGADQISLSQIATKMLDLAHRAREGQLGLEEYQGGTASISNLGSYGVRQFDAVINPPQSMIMAVGAGQKRPHIVDDILGVATIMEATGSFDHRAIDGAEGARLMQSFKYFCEHPLELLV